MKKVICLVLSAVLLLVLFTGCRPETGKVEWTAAVDERIVKGISGPKDEAIRVLGLTEANKSEGYSIYTAELVWCGMPMNTEIGFRDDVFYTAYAKGTFEDNKETEALISECLSMLEKQFNEPYGYQIHEFDYPNTGVVGSHDIPDMQTFLETLSDMDDGGVGLRYSLSGENGGTGDEGPYMDAMFLKYVEEPGKIRFMFSVQNFER